MFNAPWMQPWSIFIHSREREKKRKETWGQTEFHWSNSIDPILDLLEAAFRFRDPLFAVEAGRGGEIYIDDKFAEERRRPRGVKRCLTWNTVKQLDGEKREEGGGGRLKTNVPEIRRRFISDREREIYQFTFPRFSTEKSSSTPWSSLIIPSLLLP